MTDRAGAPERSPYDLLGGEAGVRALVQRFYDIMDAAPEAAGIRRMHAADLGPVREYLFQFLSGWLGGPPLYFSRQDRPCIRSAHAMFAIGPAERDEWLSCMSRALAETGVDPQLRERLELPFFRIADMLRTV